MYVCICIYICIKWINKLIYIYMYMCVYIYIYYLEWSIG